MISVRKKTHNNMTKRICAMFLCIVMIFTIMPEPFKFAKAATPVTTQTEALNRLVEWGIMRGDQAGNLSPERAITRAEFVTMLNRTFGYKKAGIAKFTDVVESDWYYDDIGIAATAGYFQGTDKSVASPNRYLTREAAVVMISRNIMLQPQSGEDLSFTDSHDASSWSRGYIKAAAEKGIVKGDPSGAFRPKKNISRGEVAIMLARIIGTPVQTSGTYSNDVSGNLMVSTSGVTLNNMIITGDLYITGGVGLGYVNLNNVSVYGSIIASGSGESNKGDCSIILKNSTAAEMIVDSPSNQYITIRTTGTSIIDKTFVRTNAYLEDKTDSGYGMKYIEVDGEEGLQLDLSENIKEVVAVSPKTKINVGKGTVEKLTIDETALNSTVKIDQGAVVKILNLDTGTMVTGKGDISSLYVNAPGCKVDMLPDYIYIRPGITANIGGIEMDSTLAQQMSDAPRILAGFPRSDDIAPNKATTKYMTNKSGTIYWAVRMSGDGPMSANDIITPPSYGAKVLKNGNIKVNDANTLVSTDVNGLQFDTSYILSAVFVDSKGQKSPVKVLYLSTPDNSKPAFSSGYPKATAIEDTYVIFDLATNKTCNLHWAIYKKGMTAPTANDFRDGTLSGAIDHGMQKMIKNEDDDLLMGNVIETEKDALEELTEYDVYFFLTDNVNDSAIIKITIKTADRTPPEFIANYPRITKVTATGLNGEGMINEDGKIYWSLVKHGTEYPITNPALSKPDEIELDRKLQIKGGMYSLKSGSAAAKEGKVSNLSFSGLEAETAYDIYFVAEDNSGNLSKIVFLKNAKTLDKTPPTVVEQRFSITNNDGVPLASTDITLVFSENIYSSQTRTSLVDMYLSGKNEFEVYGTKDKITFAQVIKNMFILKNLDITTPDNSVDINVGANNENVIIKLSEEGQTEVTFKSAGLKLKSGTNYQFLLNYVTDASNNNMKRETPVDKFKTLDAQIDLTQLTERVIQINGESMDVDTIFSAIPFANSTQNASETSAYDFLFASDTNMQFDIYWRYQGTENQWQLASERVKITKSKSEKWTAASFNAETNKAAKDYPYLTKFPTNGYEFAIKIRSIDGIDDPGKWNATINMKIFCIAGNPNNIENLVSKTINTSDFEQAIKDGEISSIGNPTDFPIKIVRVNQSPPQFNTGYPVAQPGDSVTTIEFTLDRAGEVFYVIAPEDKLAPLYVQGFGRDDEYPRPPERKPNDFAEFDIGKMNPTHKNEVLFDGQRIHNISLPRVENIMEPENSFSPSEGYRFGSIKYDEGAGVTTITAQDLLPRKRYYVYFVLKGSYKDPSNVIIYSFNTSDVIPPVLQARADGTAQASYTISSSTNAVVRADTNWAWYTYVPGNYPRIFDTYVCIREGGGYNVGDVLEYLPEEADEKQFKTALELIKLNVEGNSQKNQFQDLTEKYPMVRNLANELWNNLVEGASSVQGFMDEGKKTMTSPSTNPGIIDQTKMKPGTKYILFVAARNTNGGIPVFDIVDNLTKVSAEYPRIKNISSSLTANPAGQVSGSITIQFDKDLYVPITDTSPVRTISYSKIRNNDNNIIPNDSNALQFTSCTNASLTIRFSNATDTYFNIVPQVGRTSPTQDVEIDNVFCSRLGVARGEGEGDNPVSIRIAKTIDDTDKENPKIIYEAVINGGPFDGLKSELTEEELNQLNKKKKN